MSAVRTTTSGARQPWYIYILAFISAIGGFLFGYDTGVVAGASLPIGTKFKFNTLEKELFVSITGTKYGLNIFAMKTCYSFM